MYLISCSINQFEILTSLVKVTVLSRDVYIKTNESREGSVKNEVDYWIKDLRMSRDWRRLQLRSSSFGSLHESNLL